MNNHSYGNNNSDIREVEFIGFFINYKLYHYEKFITTIKMI